MKRPQTKFHAHTMRESQFIRSKKGKFIIRQKFIVRSNFFAAQFFSLKISICYWNCNNRYWCAFASL